MRLSWIWKLTALVLVILALSTTGLLVAVQSINLDQLKQLLTAYVQTSTGRACTIAGPLELRLGLITRVVARSGATLANPPGCTRSDMVRIDHLEMEISLLPLLKHQVLINHLIISSPDILVETAANGSGNLEFTPSANNKQPSSADVDGGSAYRFILREITIEKGLVTWHDRTAGRNESMEIHKLTLIPDLENDGPLSVRLAAATRGHRFEIEGSLGRFDSATGDKPWSLDLKGRAGTIMLTGTGVVADLPAFRGLDVKLAARGAELMDVVHIAGLKDVDASAVLGSFTVSGRLNDAGGTLSFIDVEAAAGNGPLLSLNAKGAVREIGSDAVIDGAIRMESENPTALSSLFGTDVPLKGPIQITSQVHSRGETWKMSDIKAVLAGNDITGDLSVEVSGRPHLVGKLSANTLTLKDVITPAPGSDKNDKKAVVPADSEKGKNVRISQDQPSPPPFLQAWDVDLALQADTLVLGSHQLTGVVANLQLHKGNLSLKPFRLGFSWGIVEGWADLDVVLETAVTGSDHLGGQQSALKKLQPAIVDGVSNNRFTLREINVDKGLVTWHDRTAGRDELIKIRKLSLLSDRATGGALGINLIAEARDHTFAIEGTAGRVDSAIEGKPWPLNLKITVEGAVLTAKGVVAEPSALRGLDLKLTAQGREFTDAARLVGWKKFDASAVLGPFNISARLNDKGASLNLIDIEATVGNGRPLLLNAKGTARDVRGATGFDLGFAVESNNLAYLSSLTGKEMPSRGPVKASGLLRGSIGTSWNISDIKATLANTDLTGELTVNVAKRPHLAGKLSTNALNLNDFITPAALPGKKTASRPKGGKGKKDRIFSDQPLPVQTLQACDMDLALQAGSLTFGDYQMTDFDAELHLTQGQLTLKPVRFGLAGGRVEGEVAVDEAGASSAARVQLTGKQIELGRLIKGGLLNGGRSEVMVNLKGRGQSVRTLMASAAGETVVSVGEGTVHDKTINWAASDLLFQVAGALNPLAKREDTAHLSCAAVRFIVNDGIATADEGIAMRTAKVDVMGSGTVDLRSERLNLTFLSRAREGFGLSLSSPLNGFSLGGTLAKPAIGVKNTITVGNAASVGAAVATGGLSVLGQLMFDKVSADSDPCRTVLSQPAASPEGRQNKQGGTKIFQRLFGP